MDITNENFEELLPYIYICIQEADFITIDAEMTGLNSCNYKPSFLDTVEERYKRTAITVPEFLIIEFGLCAFKWDELKGRYVIHILSICANSH